MTSEVFANSPVPGRVTPIAVLAGNGGQVSSSATTINVLAALPAALQSGGQFHALIDSELVIVPTQTGTALTGITRGVEGSTAAAHSDGASIFPLLTAGALANALAGIAVTKAAVIATGLAPADISAASATALTSETSRATTAEALLVPLSQKAAANGVASLDSGGQVPVGQLGNSPSGVALAGDLGGTPTAPVVETVQGGLTPVNISSFLGFSQVVRPSGDATGVTDLANINAALADAGTSSVYLNGNYVVNGVPTMRSNTTLIFADASITLLAATNLPLLANASYASPTTPAATNFHIRGIGRALLDYNGSNQTEQVGALYNSCSMVFVNASNFSIEGIQFTDAQYVHINLQGCSDGKINNIHCARTGSDKGFVHTDWGCSDITIDGVTASGTFADSVFSLNTVDGTAAGRTPYAAASLTGAAGSVSGITFRNVTLASSTGMFSCAPNATSPVTDIDIENIHNTYTGATAGNEVDLGAAGYSGSTLPAHNAVAGWRVKGYTFGGTSHSFLALGTDLTDFYVSGVRANGSTLGLISAGAALPGSYFPQLNRIKFSDVNLPTLGAAGALSLIPAGYQVNGLEFDGIEIGTANGALFKHTSDVSGLKARIKVGTLNANPFQSTGNEIGEVSLTYAQKGASLTAVLSNTVNFKLVPPFPAIWTPDTTPAPVHGSELDCFAGKDPTGGAATTGGKYKADGSKWNLVTGLNGTFRPGQLYYPLLAHYDAAKIGVANGAGVPKWVDSANNNNLVQATGALQPTFVAADATLNGLPSVAFNGSSQFLQNALLTPLSQSKPYTAFVVYYYTTLQATSWIFQGATTGATGDTFFRYFKNGTVNNMWNGTSQTVAGATTLVVSTPYIGCVAVTGATVGSIGENKAAQASLASGSVNGAGTISGLTLGAGFTPNNWAPIHVAELFIYPAALTSGDYATVMAALAAKYAITLS